MEFPEADPVPLGQILSIGDCSKAAAELFQSIIIYDGLKRLSAKEALHHHYFTEDQPHPASIEEMPVPKAKKFYERSRNEEVRIDYSMHDFIENLSELC